MVDSKKTEVILMEYYLFSSNIKASIDKDAIHPILSELWRGFCHRASEIIFEASKECILRIGQTDPSVPTDTLCVTKNGIFLSASDKTVLQKGYLTLLQLIEIMPNTKSVSSLRVPIGEYPIQKQSRLQMLHLCVFPETTLSFLQKTIRLAGVLGYTHVIPEFWGTYRFNCLKELAWKEHSYTKEQLLPLFDEARAMGMEVVPMFNHLGHASGSRMRSGKHVVLDQDPTLASLFGDDGWSWNIENPHTLELLRGIREELYELCGNGSYFHIGCDECYTYGASEEQAAPLAAFLKTLCQEILAEGRRPILWGDMLLCKKTLAPPANQPFECNAYSERTAAILADALPKQALIADWHYDVNETPWRTTKYLQSLGFEVLCCPCYKYDNILSAAKTAEQCQTAGILETTWHFLSSDMHMIHYAAVAHLPQEAHMLRSRMATQTAALLRKVCFVDGNYAEAGWSQKQVDDRV